MGSEWRNCTLGQAITLKRGYDLPAKARRPGSIPVISSSGYSDKHDAAKVHGPGVITGRYGTIGIVTFAENHFWPLNTTLYVEDFKGNSPRFIYYLLQTIDFHKYNDKAAVPGINRNHLHLADIRLPSLTEQESIANILQTIDDRIDLLSKNIAVLEHIAQALFKSWFIDFNPVRAKHENRELELEHSEAVPLFCDRFKESSLGLMPSDWKEGTINDISQKIGMGPFGSDIKTSTFVEQGVPILNGSCLKEILLQEVDLKFITEEHAERLVKSQVRSGDIVITHRGTLGQVSLVPETSRSAFMLSQSQFFLRANKNLTTAEFLTYFLRSSKGQHLLLSNASQVGVPSIARPVTHLKSIRLAIPCIQIALAFADKVTPLHRRIVANREQMATLSALRDTLLPRLISGKLRLPEARARIEEATA